MSRSFLQQRNINLVGAQNYPSLLWAPDGGGDGRTWEQIYSIINSSNTPVNIVLEGDQNTDFTIPAGDYNIHFSNFVGITFPGFEYELRLENGVMINDLNRINGAIKIESFGSGGNVINCVTPNNLCVFIAGLGCVVKNSGTAPIFTVQSGNLNVLAFFGGRTEIGNPAIAIMHVPAGETALLYCVDGSGPFTDNIISGPVGATVVLEHDGSIPFPFPTQSLFLGTLLNSPQGVDGGAGPTSFRPVPATGPVSVGCEYFDTDIGIPVYWTGAIWVDSTGAPA